MARRKALGAVQALWRQHYGAPFPKGLAGKEVSGIDVTSLDSFATGCIDTFLHNGGKLDLGRTALLGLCYRDLSVALTKLAGERRDYFARLETMARLVLEAVCDGARLP